MDLKKYLINMILMFDNHEYTKLELYTKTCVELSSIKNELLMRDNVNIKEEYICTII